MCFCEVVYSRSHLKFLRIILLTKVVDRLFAKHNDCAGGAWDWRLVEYTVDASAPLLGRASRCCHSSFMSQCLLATFLINHLFERELLLSFNSIRLHKRRKARILVILHVFQLGLKHTLQVYILFLSLLYSDVLPLSGGDFSESIVKEFGRSLVVTEVWRYKLDMWLDTIAIDV